MEHALQNYQPKLIDLFKGYLKTSDTTTLVKGLNDLDAKIKRDLRSSPKSKQGFWFRFSEDDTLATTPLDVARTLQNPNTNNGKFMVENMKYAVDNKSPLVLFS